MSPRVRAQAAVQAIERVQANGVALAPGKLRPAPTPRPTLPSEAQQPAYDAFRASVDLSQVGTGHTPRSSPRGRVASSKAAKADPARPAPAATEPASEWEKRKLLEMMGPM